MARRVRGALGFAATLSVVARAGAEPRLTLADCLKLAEANAPQLAIAAQKVAQAHAQLDEVRWVPWSQWSAGGTLALAPEMKGSGVYSPEGDLSASTTMAPAWRVTFDGIVPVYTFGKIEHSSAAAAAFVESVRAEGQRARDLIRHDVRRAYVGLQLARDGRYLVKQLRKEIGAVVAKMRADDGLDDSDVARVELFWVEMGARLGEFERLEGQHTATLRLLTGLEPPKPFDIPEDPLATPRSTLGDELLYLKSARLHRPEVKQVGAGIRARSELVEFSRAKLFPDVGMYLGAGFASAPIVSDQTNAFVVDNFNFYRYNYAFPFQWKPELLPNAARIAVAQAQLSEVRNLELFALRGFGVEVVNAYAAARDAETREKSYGEAVQISKRWYVSAGAAIGAGLRPDSDLFEPLRSYMMNRYNHLMAMHDLAVARSQLALSTGDDGVALAP
jgi:outer membrane protein TolC